MMRPFLAPFFAIALAAMGSLDGELSAQRPHPNAHAHNDYLHDRPLLDALEHGFCSVEADIFLVGDQLQVAHTRAELNPGRTLESLYLEPLRELIELKGGSVHGDGTRLTLLIDIKSKAETTYLALSRRLARYRNLLCWEDENGQLHDGPVQIIISGNRALDLIATHKPRFAGMDGRLSDLDREVSADLMPLISDNWRNKFKWRGEGELSEEESKRLSDWIDQIHRQGRRVRFWATPDRPEAWQVLKDAGVDLINTDDLSGLDRFLSGVSTSP